MNLDVLNKLNVDNLTQLWKALGTQVLIKENVQRMHHSKSWPHRSWFDWGTNLHQSNLSILRSGDLPNNRMVPVWGGCADSLEILEPALVESGFNVSLEQFAMYLDLSEQQFKKTPAFECKQVTSMLEIDAWVGIASKAFGYPIDAAAFHHTTTNPDIRLLLAYWAGEPAGTALLFKTGDVIGVHLVGVSPNFRGRGIAKALMQQIIGDGHLWAGKTLTLQASAAGEPLYRQLGFQHQFVLRSYQRG